VTVRRRFIFTSSFIAALTVAWSATPVAAGPITTHAAIPASVERATSAAHAHTGASVTAALGSLPVQLRAFPGGGELTAIANVGSSGNTAVTTPADPSIAVGPTSVVEAVNSALFVYARTGGVPTVFGINTMINNSISSGWAVRSPRVVYDPASGRFILMVLEFRNSTCGSQVVIMVSQPNPLLPWTARGSLIVDPQLAPPPGGNWVFGDASLALTATLIVESSDYQACTSGALGAFAASQTDVIQRADLVGGAMTLNSVVFQAGGPIGVQPVMALGLASVAYEIANGANCTAVQASTVAVFKITGTPDGKNVANTCTSSFSESSGGSSIPPAAPQGGGTSATLQTHDDRFLNAVWGNNMLWATGNTGCTPGGDSTTRACLNVVHATATTAGSVSGGAQLTPEGVSGAYLYYPSLAMDAAGDVMVTFDESSGSTPESIMLASITGGSTWSSFATLDTSTAFYAPAGCALCSWGDYSGAVQDALHPGDVWVVSSDDKGDTGTGCTTSNSCWNTYIARYTFAAPSVSAMTPSSGPGGGGQSVTVFGSDFASSTTATFGPLSSPSPPSITPRNVTPDSFTFTTPPGPAAGGFYQLIATDPLGSSSATATASAYLYIPLSNYTAVPPFRILDTRSTSCVQCGPGALGAGATRALQVTGVGTSPVPTTAVAVALNVTAVAGTASSLLSVYPRGSPQPSTSNLNFRAGSVTPNLVTVALGSGGDVNVFNSVGVVNVVVDLEGYFAPPASPTSAGEFHPIAPTRVCDTRYATYVCHGALIGGTPRLVIVAQGAIPNTGTAAAAVLNLTAVAGSAMTYLAVYPTSSNGTCATGSNLPGVATINVSAGQVAANRVMVKLGPTTSGGPDTSACVYSAAGSINVVLDANGWFGSATAPAGYQFQATVPTRICDTRTGSQSCSAGALGARVSRLIGVAGHGGVPAVGGSNPVVQAVIANLTGIAPSVATYLVAYSASLTAAPGSSDLSLQAGDVRGNLIVVQLDTTAGAPDGFMELFNAAGSVNAAVDIEGWFQ
jgi:serine protease